MSLLLLAAVCALPRFGQRENEHLPKISDSDLYLEMARVFIGDQTSFTAEFVSAQPHHYNRPLLSFLAGYLAKYALGGNFRAAFSLINIAAATAVAVLLAAVVRKHRPEWRLFWLPSALFLTGFPQLNWGYHILTDTLGYATAFISACYAGWLIEQGTTQSPGPGFWSVHLLVLFISSSLAFLARETAWFTVIVGAWLAFQGCRQAGKFQPYLGLVVLVLALGKLPHAFYSHAWGVSGVPLKSSIGEIFDWRYVLDFVVKSGVAFNLSWLLAGAALWRFRSRTTPPFIVGWTIAAVLYIGAGYFVNKIHLIGYPLRMTFSLFPFVFLWATELIESSAPGSRRVVAGLGYLLFQFLINIAGMALDPGTSGIKATDVLQSIRDFLTR